jgi:hypothetical protein
VSLLDQLYLRSVVLIDDGDGLVSAADSRLVAAETVFVITAWNPGEQRPSREENETANEQLRRALVGRGLEPCRAVGQDPSSPHYEESWAVTGLDDEASRDLGAAFGQTAVFRLRSGVQAVLACSADWSCSRPLQGAA